MQQLRYPDTPDNTSTRESLTRSPFHRALRAEHLVSENPENAADLCTARRFPLPFETLAIPRHCTHPQPSLLRAEPQRAMYADRVASGTKRSIRDRLDGNLAPQDLARNRPDSLKRFRLFPLPICSLLYHLLDYISKFRQGWVKLGLVMSSRLIRPFLAIYKPWDWWSWEMQLTSDLALILVDWACRIRVFYSANWSKWSLISS